MSNRSIYYNIYAMLNIKPKYYGLFIISIILLLYFFHILSSQKIKAVTNYQAVYFCEKNCFLQIIMPYDEAKKINKSMDLEYMKNSLKIENVVFGKLEILDNSSVAWQTIKIQIPKQELYNNQTIEVSIVLEEKSIMKKIIESLKGGD